MHKALKVLSTLIICLFILSLYGWMVNQISNKKKEFGFLTEPIKFMYNFPNLFEESVEEVKKLPQVYLPTPKNFEPINKLEKDLNVLISYPDKKDDRVIAVMNLRNDSISKSWTIKNKFKNTTRIMHPILYEDGSLLYKYNEEKPGLIMMSPKGETVWKNDKLVPHHGMNLTNKGDIWACTYNKQNPVGIYYINGEEVRYKDFRITKYDKKTGKILYDKSITGILQENDLGSYLLKTDISKDPLHLNDVQPALKTTEFYKEDDVFISIRNISLIIHYRPSTNELIDLIEGPFAHQHDVDFLNDSTLIMFNNNTFRTWPGSYIQKLTLRNRKTSPFAGGFQTNVMSYNLRSKKFKVIGNEVFKKNKIHSVTEGIVEFVDEDTYFIEQQNDGILWVIQGDEVLYKNVLESHHKGHHHMPNWTRVISYDGELLVPEG